MISTLSMPRSAKDQKLLVNIQKTNLYYTTSRNLIVAVVKNITIMRSAKFNSVNSILANPG